MRKYNLPFAYKGLESLSGFVVGFFVRAFYARYYRKFNGAFVLG